MVIFVLPFAGGSAMSFIKWNSYNINFVFIEVQGKGRRRKEGFSKDICEIAEDVKTQIIEYLNRNTTNEYAIWGHSMGSYVAYETLIKLVSESIHLPKHVIFSGTIAPKRLTNLGLKDKINASEHEFIEYIVSLGLADERTMNNRVMQRMFLPAIKNDYQLLCSYLPTSSDKLNINAIIMNGDEDGILEEDVIRWNDYFVQTPQYFKFKGGHFFIFTECETIFAELRDKIR